MICQRCYNLFATFFSNVDRAFGLPYNPPSFVPVVVLESIEVAWITSWELAWPLRPKRSRTSSWTFARSGCCPNWNIDVSNVIKNSIVWWLPDYAITRVWAFARSVIGMPLVRLRHELFTIGILNPDLYLKPLSSTSIWCTGNFFVILLLTLVGQKI